MDTSHSLFTLLGRLFQYLSPRRRRQLVLTATLMLVCSLAEIVSLSAVIPFLAVLSEPEKIWAASWTQPVSRWLGWQTPADMRTAICLLFALVAAGVGGIRILMLWVNFKLANAIGEDLGTEAYRRTLYQPYQVHVSRNSSEVQAVITVDVQSVVLSIQSLLHLATALLVSLGLILTLIWINPQVALIVTVALGAIYGYVVKTARKRLRKNSQGIVVGRRRMVQILQEGLGAIRDIILDGNQDYYVKNFQKTLQRLCSAQTVNGFISAYPRYGLEAAALVVIAALAWGLSYSETDSNILATLGVYALGGQRLLPAVQQIYLCWSSLSGNYASIGVVLSYVEQPIDSTWGNPVERALSFKDTIRFENVSFVYQASSPWMLKDLNFTIRAGERVGFVGKTGSGKSTCLDLLMGLLVPSQGQILVDGIHLTGDYLRRWQKCIAHVPQSVYLADASIAENIALGVPMRQIDMERIRQAAEMAQIADFIEVQPQGYESFVGERGIRLSGGQRQRIGIARALYKQAKVLVFDEATSALDNLTERELMDSINSLSNQFTIILIAHRLSTIKNCDKVFEVGFGQVQESFKNRR